MHKATPQTSLRLQRVGESLFDEPLAEGAGVGKVDGELHVAVGALRLFCEERHVIARVVRELIGVAGVERLGRSEDGRERLRVRLENRRIADVFHHALGTVHREDARGLDHLVAADEGLSVLVMVRVHGERQPFQKGAVNAGWIAEVDRRTEHKDVRPARPLENWTQVVAQCAHAVGLCVLELADETASAAGELDVVEVHEFGDGTCLLCAGFGGFEHLVRVPTLARARVEEHREWFVVDHFGFPFCLFDWSIALHGHHSC